MTDQLVLLYIVYGENEVYYNGAKFSILSFLNSLASSDTRPKIIVLTEKPDLFEGYPVETVRITKAMRNAWSVDGKYHFRIKNRGMRYITENYEFAENSKLLFIDADTYFTKNANQLFGLIKDNQALMFLNEGNVNKKKKFSLLQDGMANKTLQLPNFGTYSLSNTSTMWGSLMIGLRPSMFNILDYADELMLALMHETNIHTIEQFALAEALQTQYLLVEGKKFVSHYSTSGKKAHAESVLRCFFRENSNKTFAEQLTNAREVKLKRGPLTVIKQKLEKRKRT